MTSKLWPCLCGLALLIAGCGKPIGAPVTTQATSQPAAGSGSRVTVTTKEWKIDVSPATVAPGTVSLTIRNEGKQPHGIYVDGPGIDRKASLTEPGKTSELTVELASGEFNLTDFVKQNEFDHNMKATLTVKQARD